MKRVISWAVALVLEIIGMYIVSFIATFCVNFGRTVYASHPGLFWIIIFLGGTFGLSVVSGLAIFVPKTVIIVSDKICESKNGMRYKVIGWTLAMVYGLASVVVFLAHSFPDLIKLIVMALVYVGMNIVLTVLANDR